MSICEGGCVCRSVFLWRAEEVMQDDSTTNVGHRDAISINLNSPSVAFGWAHGETTNTVTNLMSPYYTERRPNQNLDFKMFRAFRLFVAQFFLHI